MAASAKVEKATLLDVLRAEIERNGPLSIAAYMELCLSHPQHGYYMTRDPLGARGDFITAPEVSQMFGEILGAYIATRWQDLGTPAPFHLIECGPGRGTLMRDMLRVISHAPNLMSALQIHLIEISPALKKIQQEALKDFSVTWHNSFEGVPQGPFVLVANEFLDALPLRQYQFHKGEWYERCVGLREDALAFVAGEAGLPQIAANEGEIFEYARERESFVQQICARLKNDKGVALLIDYGADKSGFGDTLQAISKHTFAPVLENPGDCDLTSHVDFGALRETALAEGFKSEIVTQGEFLTQNGIIERAAALKKQNPDKNIEADLERLIADDQMGALFKVMIILS